MLFYQLIKNPIGGWNVLMESSLTKAYKIKIQSFEGPFDLLFHLIEKNKINIYDIPINEITDQYMDYLSTMQELDLEIASEFLLMAATLLHIKSRMLLPDRKEIPEEVEDPREELVVKLIEYKKFKDFSEILKEREKEWSKLYYKFPEIFEIRPASEILELSPEELKRTYSDLLQRRKRRINQNTGRMEQIVQREKVSLKTKMREIIRTLYKKGTFIFSELFAPAKKSKIEIVTGFMAVLELTKLRQLKVEQKKMFSDIHIYKTDNYDNNTEEGKIAARDW